MVIKAPKNANGTAVPAIEAANEPFYAIAAVGAIMAMDSAAASQMPSSRFSPRMQGLLAEWI